MAERAAASSISDHVSRKLIIQIGVVGFMLAETPNGFRWIALPGGLAISMS